MWSGASRLVPALLLCVALAAPAAGQPPTPPLQDLTLEDLLRVTVTAASREQKTARDAPATVYVVTEDMIRERGYQFLYDALRDAPGIDITWMGGLYGPILNVRGLDTPENNKLILMIDGVVDNNLSAGTAQVYMQYSLHHVKRIEVVYGPASALHGANAMAGVINLVTRTGGDLAGARVDASAIAWDPELRRTGWVVRAAAGTKRGTAGRELELSGALHVVHTRGPDLRLGDEPRSDRPSDPAGADYYFSPDHVGSAELGTFMAQGQARLEAAGLTAGVTLWQHRGGQGTYGHEGYAFLNGLQDKPDVWNFRNTSAWLRHTHSFGTRVRNTASMVFRDTRILDDTYDLYFTRVGTGPDGPGAAGAAGTRYFRPDHSFRLEDAVTWELGTRATLAVGAAAEKQRVSDYQTTATHSFDRQRLVTAGTRPTLDERKRYDWSIWSGYAELGARPTERLAITAGLRLDVFELHGEATPVFFGTNDLDATGACRAGAPACRTPAEAAAVGATEVSRVYYRNLPHEESRTSLNPRLGAVFTTASDRLTLKGLYGEGYRVPTVRELYSVTGSRFNNPGLQPEKVRTGELSATYEVTGRGYVQAALFRTTADGLIQLVPSDVLRPGRETFLNRFLNEGQAHMLGADVTLQARSAAALDVFVHYSFVRARYDQTQASNRAHVPDTADALDGSSRIPRVSEHKALLGASWSAAGGRLVLSPRVRLVGSRPGVITSPRQEAAGYVCLDLAATLRDLGRKGLDVQLSAYNLTNADILDPGFRTGNKIDDFPAAHPQPGFNALLQVALRF